MYCGSCSFFKNKKEEILEPFNGIYGKIYQTTGLCCYFNQKVNEMDYCIAETDEYIEEDWAFRTFLEMQEKDEIKGGF